MQIVIDFLTSNRVKSFLWRLGMMFVAGGVSALSAGMTGLGLNQNGLIVMGLILGEISHYLNNLPQTI